MAGDRSGNALQTAVSRPIINMTSERIEIAQEQRVVAIHVGQQSQVGPDHVNFCFDEVGTLRVTAQRQEGEPEHLLYLDPEEEEINYICIKTTRAVRAFMIIQAARSQSSRRIRNNSSCPERMVSCSSLQIVTTKNRTLLVCGRYSHYDTEPSTWIDLRQLPELSLIGCMIVKGSIDSCTLIERLHDTHIVTRRTLTFEPLQIEHRNEQNNMLGG